MAFYICSNCGYGCASWLGRCPDCGQWNTLKEQPDSDKGKTDGKEAIKKLTVTPLIKIKPQTNQRIKTGIFEFDRVLGGGLIPGEVILLTGEPGVGKSTLLLQSLQNLRSLYISGEESAEQVKNRAERLNVNVNNFLISDTLQVEGIIEGIKELTNKIDILVIDSIQTVYSKEVESPTGSISQLKESTGKLINFAKRQKLPIILVGHITKEGEIAGPKTLEHMVDCVLNFEGEKISQFRLLRATKNRFGPTDEIGIFEMKTDGLKEITNPLVFVNKQEKTTSGKAIVGTVEGKRPLFFEIQTLVTPTQLAFPRRVVAGLDYNKVLLLLAVTKKQLFLPIDKYDVYVNVTGGVSIKSTASDLGLIASLISSFKNIPTPANSVFIGEVSLLGEVRRVYFEEKIIKEAKRLGFKKIFSATNIGKIKNLKNIFS
ncbi:MAG: DNA repair protein RadA [Microgenomates group bacterium]